MLCVCISGGLANPKQVRHFRLGFGKAQVYYFIEYLTLMWVELFLIGTDIEVTSHTCDSCRKDAENGIKTSVIVS